LQAATTAAVDKGAGISWVAQYLKNTPVGRNRPSQITLLLTHALAARKTKAVIDHPAHRLEGRSGVLKSVEHQPHRRLYRCIGVEAQHAVVLIDETDGRVHLEFAAAGFVEYTPTHPRL
jgi:hypothetical protein